MFEEVRKAIGANWFRAFVLAFGLLWVWHSFFSSVFDFGQSRNVNAIADNAAKREKAIADKARVEADALGFRMDEGVGAEERIKLLRTPRNK
jgi:hypothetical protein